jgi:DNA-binding XRE family transcriptional regulator
MELGEIRRHYRDILEHKYSDTADGVFMRVNIIRALEKELKTEFIDSYDFRRKMDSFCAHGKKIRFTDGRKLREARRAKKWTQAGLADHLGYTRQTIIRYENNSEPLSKKALIWLERQSASSGEM